jgi:hypothetical protein
MPRGLDAAHTRHANVEQHNRRPDAVDELQGIVARGAHIRYSPTRQFADQTLQALACGRFVVHDQHGSGR